MSDQRIYLASRSPRRRDLLKQIGVPFELMLLREDLRRGVDIDEMPLPDESPGVYVLRIARTKVEMAVRQIAYRALPQKPVLAADTTVVVDGVILAKPRDRADGIAMLGRLSGRTHQVMTAVALATASGIAFRLSVSEVRMRAVTPEECTAYWETGEPRDKAGGYAIQGRGALFIEHLSGSFSGVMGLPLYETGQLLAEAGIRW